MFQAMLGKTTTSNDENIEVRLIRHYQTRSTMLRFICCFDGTINPNRLPSMDWCCFPSLSTVGLAIPSSLGWCCSSIRFCVWCCFPPSPLFGWCCFWPSFFGAGAAFLPSSFGSVLISPFQPGVVVLLTVSFFMVVLPFSSSFWVVLQSPFQQETSLS